VIVMRELFLFYLGAMVVVIRRVVVRQIV